MSHLQKGKDNVSHGANQVLTALLPLYTFSLVMNKKFSIRLTMILLCGSAIAQVQQDFDSAPPAAEEPGRKRPSIFHRPARDTSMAQLQHARDLQARGRTRKAMNQYRALVHRWHSAPEAHTAQEAYARLLEDRRSYKKAMDEYQYLIDYFPGQFSYSEIVARQFAIAHHVMTDAERRMTRSTKRALPMLEAVTRNAPNGPHAAECSFYLGWIYESHKEYIEAASAYERVLYRYPSSKFAPSASFRNSFCLYTMALRHHRDELLLREALSALTQFLRDYSGDANEVKATQYRDELKELLADSYYERAVFYDRKAKRPDSAVIAYRDYLRKFPSSERAIRVSARIEELQKTLQSLAEQEASGEK